jgi:hypothetical protein
MPGLRLIRAPNEDADKSRNQFKDFLEEQQNEFVSARTDDAIRSAIADQSLFFIVDDQNTIVATTAFYWHGDEGGWGELGSTLVDKRYRGLALQSVMYRHIVSLKWLSAYPKHLFAVVDDRATSSYSNIERFGFDRLKTVPPGLVTSAGKRNWSPIREGKKRLYLLSKEGLKASLLFAAEHGATFSLTDRSGTVKNVLNIEFNYLKSPDLKNLLLQEADTIADWPRDGAELLVSPGAAAPQTR